jgi:hypothetical protein
MPYVGALPLPVPETFRTCLIGGKHSILHSYIFRSSLIGTRRPLIFNPLFQNIFQEVTQSTYHLPSENLLERSFFSLSISLFFSLEVTG